MDNMSEGLCYCQGKQPLPPCYRFLPTDAELLQHYLLPKVQGKFIDPEIIPEIDFYECNPFVLPGMNKFTYFFTKRERKCPNGIRAERRTRDGRGYWKITSKINNVEDDNKLHLGKRNTLVYFVRKPGGKKADDYRTNWSVQEFELAETLFPSTSRVAQGEQFNDFVVCKICNWNKEKGDNEELKDMINTLIGPKPVMTHNNGERVLPSQKRKFEPDERLITCHPHPHDATMTKEWNHLCDSHELQDPAMLDNMKTIYFGQTSDTSARPNNIIRNQIVDEEQNSGLLGLANDLAVSRDVKDVLSTSSPLYESSEYYYRELFRYS